MTEVLEQQTVRLEVKSVVLILKGPTDVRIKDSL